MIDPLILLTFIPASLALNLTPGADMMFCIGQGLRGGPRAAWAASTGVALGGLIHVTLAGIGLSAAIAAMPNLFNLIRWIGIAYLLWLAWQAFTQGVGVAEETETVPARHSLRDGLIVNLMNPKVILFVLAFIPQFVDPMGGPVLLQFLIFGAFLSLGGLIINGVAGALAGRAGQKFLRSEKVSQRLGYGIAGIFVFLALRLAMMERSQ